jgi:hypothetical protein
MSETINWDMKTRENMAGDAVLPFTVAMVVKKLYEFD